ncbi:DUF1565 domain-containing protein, partial [candidate division KSB3 bacterium]|nr:DUF1565 domain-containing protein [candidate division KSB3 bacterium]MBD3326889.1 DUF1565 domain-containing protein [candidate division KSB3 bacterium]
MYSARLFVPSRQCLSVYLLTLALLLVVGSCHWLEHDSSAPTAPGLSPLVALNYSSTGGSSHDEYQVRLGESYIVLNIPTSGDYRIDYTVQPDAAATLAAAEELSGPYQLFARQQAGSVLHQIGIVEGDRPWEVCVTPGTITPQQSIWYEDGAAWLLNPGVADGHLWWGDETAAGQFVASGERWCLAEEGGRVDGVAQAPQPVVARPSVCHLYVDVTLGDDANACTSEAAPCQTITRALTLVTTHCNTIIHIAAGTYAEAELILTTSVTLLGAGAGSTILDGSGAHRVLKIESGVTAALEALTVQNGAAQDTCGTGWPRTLGGGICNRGALTLTNVTLS